MAPSDPPSWRRHPGALWRATLGGVVVLAPGSDTPHRLRGAAEAAWMSFEGDGAPLVATPAIEVALASLGELGVIVAADG